MNSALRILNIEDYPGDADMNEREVRKIFPDCEFLRVESKNDFLSSLASFMPDVILSDYKLPQFDGLTALKLSKECAPDIPFIMVTGPMNEDTAVECMKAGATDYVIKDHIIRLAPAIINGLEQKRRNTEQRLAEEKSRRWERVFEEAQFGLAHSRVSDNTFIEVNATFARERGYTPSELKDSPVLDIFPPEERVAMKIRFANMDRFGHLVFETVHMRKNGSCFPVLVEVTGIRDESGAPQSRVAYVLDTTELKHSQTLLEQSLKEKETLLRELYHRTKNNMMVISSMLSLHAMNSKSEEVAALLGELEDKIQTMALVHQKLYQSNDLSSIDLQDYIPDLVRLLMKSRRISKKDIHVDLDIDSIPVVIDIAIPCGLVLNELITNSLSHAFPDGRKGIIKIALKKQNDDKIELHYSDDGIGVPEGFNFSGQPTWGLKTIFALVERQLLGKITFSNGKGVTCKVLLSSAHYKVRI